MRGEDCEERRNKDGEMGRNKKTGRNMKSVKESFCLSTVDFNNLKGIIILMYFCILPQFFIAIITQDSDELQGRMTKNSIAAN